MRSASGRRQRWATSSVAPAAASTDRIWQAKRDEEDSRGGEICPTLTAGEPEIYYYEGIAET